MFTIACANVPPETSKKSVINNIKRIKRNMESKRLESIKKIQESVKKVAKEEVEYVKSLLPKELFDIDEE